MALWIRRAGLGGGLRSDFLEGAGCRVGERSIRALGCFENNGNRGQGVDSQVAEPLNPAGQKLRPLVILQHFDDGLHDFGFGGIGRDFLE